MGTAYPQTQVTPREQELLRQYSQGKSRLVEIGVFEGSTTRLLAEAMASDAELFAVDPFPTGKAGICWGKWIARLEAAKVPASKRIRFVETYSWKAVSMISGEFDFVFLDGDHSLEGIQHDWGDWSRRLTRNGIIALHDSIVPPHDPGVAQLGSCQFFASHISKDPDVEILEQADSLSILCLR